MARTAQKVESLAREGEDMTEALATVLAVADEQGTVSWADVSDDLTSGQWGRLIESALLVDADGSGFVLDDPEGVREALDETDPDAVASASTSTDSDDSSGDNEINWTAYDKAAAVVTLVFFAGYAQGDIRAVVGSTIDIVLGPLNDVLPFYIVILVLAIMTGLWSTILQDNLMDSEVMGEVQEKMQDLQDRREAAKERGDDEALDRIQQEQMEAMGDQLGMFKAQFRPMVWIMLLTIPAFLWMYWMIRDGHIESADTAQTVIVLPLKGAVTDWQASGLGPMPAWIVWYFLCSLGFSQLLRKALNVQTSPTG